MSLKRGESRARAIERDMRCDLDPLDAEDQHREAEFEWMRRAQAAREQREALVAEVYETKIEPVANDLQDVAARELAIIESPGGVEDLVADLEEDPELQSVAVQLLAIERPLLADLAAA